MYCGVWRVCALFQLYATLSSSARSSAVARQSQVHASHVLCPLVRNRSIYRRDAREPFAVTDGCGLYKTTHSLCSPNRHTMAFFCWCQIWPLGWTSSPPGDVTGVAGSTSGSYPNGGQRFLLWYFGPVGHRYNSCGLGFSSAEKITPIMDGIRKVMSYNRKSNKMRYHTPEEGCYF